MRLLRCAPTLRVTRRSRRLDARMSRRFRPVTEYTDRMTETTLYERLLGTERPKRIRHVHLALVHGEVHVAFVGTSPVCPACGAACVGYDRRLYPAARLHTGIPEVPVLKSTPHTFRYPLLPALEALPHT